MEQCRNVTQLHEDFPERQSQDNYISELSHTFTTDCIEKTTRVLCLTSADDYCMNKIFEMILMGFWFLVCCFGLCSFFFF